MRFKAYTGITWSVLELTGLIEDEDSQVHLELIKKHYGLHPFHLTNLNAALNEILSSNLNFYDPGLKGFPLAYRNPKVITPLGEVFYDTCFIHVDVEADFYIFRPRLETTLKGIVNKKGMNHVGVLVHKAFNVSIPSPEDEEDWPGNNIEIGQEVKFTITHLDFNSRLPFIRGVLCEEEYLQNSSYISKNESVSDAEEASQRKKRSKSEKKARRLSCMSVDENNDETLNSDTEDIEKDKLKRMKKSSKKRSLYSEEIVSAEDSETKQRSKKVAKKLKETGSSSESENESTQTDTKPSERTSQKRSFAYSDDQEEEVEPSLKQDIKKYNNFATPESTERVSSKKRSKKLKLSDSDLEFDINRVKTDPDNTIDSTSEKKVKLKKHSKNKQSDIDDSLQDSEEIDDTLKKLKKQSKKSKSNSNWEENEVRVKTEEVMYDGETSRITATPKKRRSKSKLPVPESDNTSENEEKPSLAVSKKSAKKPKEPSMIFDYDDVTVKKEKYNDSKKTADSGVARKSSKHEQADDGSDEQEKTSKKKSKKQARSSHDLSGVEDDHLSVTVKSENYVDVANDHKRESVHETPEKLDVKKKARKKTTPSGKSDLDDREESESNSTPKQHAKKRKGSGGDDDFSDVRIKRENSFKHEGTDGSHLEMNSEEETKINKSPLGKPPKKRRIFSMDSEEANSEVKVEK